MHLPYKEPLAPIEPGPRTIPEPPRRGEPGGDPCGICTGISTAAVWSDSNWTLHPPVGGSLPGPSGWPADNTSIRLPTCHRNWRRSLGPFAGPSRERSSAWATSRAYIYIAGETVALTSTSGSCRDRWGCSRPWVTLFRSGRTSYRKSPTRSWLPRRRRWATPWPPSAPSAASCPASARVRSYSLGACTVRRSVCRVPNRSLPLPFDALDGSNVG